MAKAPAVEGTTVKAERMASLAAEASKAHKGVPDVVETHKAGISLKVLRSVPMGVVKG